MLIEIASGLSFIFCVWFTFYTATQSDEVSIGQSIKDSMIEAWENIAVGFSLNFCMNMLVLPQVTVGLTWWENFMIGWIYTSVSMLRSFLIRRVNNRKELKNFTGADSMIGDES